MALFEIDESSGLPVWVQLRNRFVYLIKTGHYQPGDQLPSVRSPGRRGRHQLQHREQGVRQFGKRRLRRVRARPGRVRARHRREGR